jgi:hypothetical protein
VDAVERRLESDALAAVHNGTVVKAVIDPTRRSA